MQLDRKKPYGSNFPIGQFAFEQIGPDGKTHYFNVDGEEVNPSNGKLIDPPSNK